MEELLEKDPEAFKERYARDLQADEHNEELDEVSKCKLRFFGKKKF